MATRTRPSNWAGSVAEERGSFPAENPDPLPKLDKVSAVRDAVEKLINEVYAGKLHPRVVAGLAPLLNLQLRALEATDLERRIAEVEKLLARAEADSRGKGYAGTPAHDPASPRCEKDENLEKFLRRVAVDMGRSSINNAFKGSSS